MRAIFILFIFLFCYETSDKKDGLILIPSSPQRSGDVVKGKKYLLEGNYLDSGIPLAFFGNRSPFFNNQNVLDRDTANANVPPEFTITKAANGIDIIAPNCMQCHGSYLDGKYILGLGNSAFDGTLNQGFLAQLLGNSVKSKFGDSSPEWEAFQQFYHSGAALANGKISTKTVGTNSADKITEILIAHRDTNDLTWNSEAFAAINPEVIPIDPPAWWLLKKKNAQFTTGIGRGDFARISMASSLLTMKDSSKAQEVDQRFVDVVTFIKSIESPKYPYEIDNLRALEGAQIFENKCSKCHGTYGINAEYPNYLVHHDKIGTDPMLAQSYHVRKAFVRRYNSSWFGRGKYKAQMVPGDGYVAPPLDGIWATAPYFHNGSVPSIHHVLDSKSRPTYWRRSFNNKDYNWEDLGWKYKEKKSKIDKYTYDTTLPGYGNQGHTFGDGLTSDQRMQLIEYLKTL